MKIGKNRIKIPARILSGLKEPSCHHCGLVGAYIWLDKDPGWGLSIMLIGLCGMLIKAYRYENRYMWKAWLFLVSTAFLSLIFIDQFHNFLSFFSIYVVLGVIAEAFQDIQYFILRDLAKTL